MRAWNKKKDQDIHTCYVCLAPKNVEEFGVLGSYKDGSTKRASICRTCKSEKGKGKSHHAKGKSRRTSAYRSPGTKTRCGLTLQDYQSQYETIAGCAICGQRSKLVCDHDHSTGQFRGWLCHSCNVMLGFARDDPDILLKGSQYLEQRKPTRKIS